MEDVQLEHENVTKMVLVSLGKKWRKGGNSRTRKMFQWSRKNWTRNRYDQQKRLVPPRRLCDLSNHIVWALRIWSPWGFLFDCIKMPNQLGATATVWLDRSIILQPIMHLRILVYLEIWIDIIDSHWEKYLPSENIKDKMKSLSKEMHWERAIVYNLSTILLFQLSKCNLHIPNNTWFFTSTVYKYLYLIT